MNSSAFHLNLLKKTEVLSSSPVRLRVMLPIGALLACAGMIIWWLVIVGQSIIARTQINSIEEDLAAKRSAHSEVIEKRNTVKELKLQLEQLDYYRGGIRRIGEPLAKLAEIMPLRVQITSLTMSRPPVQDLQPKGLKVPLFGPPTNVETQKLVIAGRTTKETPVVSLMESLESADFETLVTGEKKVNSFRQDTIEFEGRKLLSFEIEYAMPGRRFAK